MSNKSWGRRSADFNKTCCTASSSNLSLPFSTCGSNFSTSAFQKLFEESFNASNSYQVIPKHTLLKLFSRSQSQTCVKHQILILRQYTREENGLWPFEKSFVFDPLSKRKVRKKCSSSRKLLLCHPRLFSLLTWLMIRTLQSIIIGGKTERGERRENGFESVCGTRTIIDHLVLPSFLVWAESWAENGDIVDVHAEENISILKPILHACPVLLQFFDHWQPL